MWQVIVGAGGILGFVEFLSRCGLNHELAMVGAAMVMENTMPATAILEPAVVDSTKRAPSAPPG